MKTTAQIFTALIALVLNLAVVSAQAADESAWGGADKGKVRLIAGAKSADGYLYAGVHIVLEKGWKTYWRVPGDSGVAPLFNWEKSQNVAEVNLLWPVPGRFRDDFGWNNGYKTETVFPVRIKANDESKPVHLAMTLHYGVCREICIPGKAELELSLSPEGSRAHELLISRYLQKVPKPLEKIDGLKVTKVQTTQAGKSVYLSVDIERTAGEAVTLFVEGPEKFYFEIPVANQTATPSHSRFKMRVDGAKTTDSHKDSKLTFTAVQGQLRLEQPWQLN